MAWGRVPITVSSLQLLKRIYFVTLGGFFYFFYFFKAFLSLGLSLIKMGISSSLTYVITHTPFWS